MNKHPRVNILDPGVGVGGTALPDPWFIVSRDKKHALIIARQVNANKTLWVIDRL